MKTMPNLNEQTGKRVRGIAGRVLRLLKSHSGKKHILLDQKDDFVVTVCTVADLKALAASCLTQSPAKSHPAPKGKR